MNTIESRISKLEGILGRGNFNSSTVQQKDATFNGRVNLINRTALPTYSSVGDLVIKNGALYVSAVANTWTAVGAVGFGGSVTSGGSGTLPAGWSVSHNAGTHVYTVTHNLGTTAYALVAVSNSSTAVTYYAPLTVINSNNFNVAFDNASAVAGDVAWTFVLTLIS